MTKAQHTPGPWFTEEMNIRTEHGIDICTVDDDPEGAAECNANARLIAAAPTLLTALTNALEALKDEYPESVWENYPAIEQAELAIAEATV